MIFFNWFATTRGLSPVQIGGHCTWCRIAYTKRFFTWCITGDSIKWDLVLTDGIKKYLVKNIYLYLTNGYKNMICFITKWHASIYRTMYSKSSRTIRAHSRDQIGGHCIWCRYRNTATTTIRNIWKEGSYYILVVMKSTIG